MEIKVINNNIFEISGVIKTMKDVEEIQNEIEKHLDEKTIILRIIDSFSIPSTLISYLIKLNELERKKIILEIKDKGLYELLQDLELEKSIELKPIK